MIRSSLCILMIVALFAGVGFASELTDSLKAGKADVKSASQLAFGPEGILFVADSIQGAIFAFDTGDVKRAAGAVTIDIKGINDKIAAQLGIAADQLLINDLDVNPISKNVYVAVSRGRGPDGIPVILRVDASGNMTEFAINNVKHSMTLLADPAKMEPSDKPGRNPAGPINANPRIDTVTDMAYLDGKVIVAGLSNEEFNSDLRTIPFPFKAATQQKGTGVRIWHSNHGRYETSSPIRTFIPYTVDKQQFLLASYTCTPLVKIPVSELKPGAKVLGKTIAEMGNNNRPLEMFAYKKDGHDFILMSNSMRGLMKISADNLGKYSPLDPPTKACEANTEENVGNSNSCGVDISGVPFQTLDIKGVWQISKLDDGHALMLVDSRGKVAFVPGNATAQAPAPGGSLDLVTVVLP